MWFRKFISCTAAHAVAQSSTAGSQNTVQVSTTGSAAAGERNQLHTQQTGERNLTHLWLFLIILVGFGLRLTGLEWGQAYSYFGSADSLEAYSFAVDYARGEPRALYIDQPNYNSQSKLPGPLWSLFCFVGMRFWGSIEGAVLATILLNTATIYLTYLLTKVTLGSGSALWAALLIATLPFPIYYSAFLYNPNVMPFLSSLLFLTLWKATQHDRSRSIFWVCLLLLVMPQFHLSGLSLIPAVLIAMFISRRRVNVRWLIAGTLAGAFLYIPYLRGESINGWQNTLAMTSGKNGHWWGGLKALTAPLNLLVNYVPQWTRNSEEYRQLGRACFGSFPAFLALNVLSALLAVILLVVIFHQIRLASRGFWRSPQQAFEHSPAVIFLAVIVLVPLFFYLISRQSFHSRYSLTVLPPLLALAGSAVAWCLASIRFARFFFAGLILVTVGNVWFMPAMYHYQGKCIDQGPFFFGSFRKLEEVYQHLKAHAGSNRIIHIDDGAYMKALSPEDDVHSEVDLVRRYVDIREKEFLALSMAPLKPAYYTLYDAKDVTPDDPAVAFCGYGIAFVAPRRLAK